VITTRFDFLAKPNVQSARTRSAARGGTKPASHKTSPRDLPTGPSVVLERTR
jgi:hypothetical protein